MLDFRRMQVLHSVITSGSLSAAARNLGYTPSAVSQQIAALEREAGLPLVERVGRGVRATSAGTLLADHTAVLSGQLAKAEAELADLRLGRTGRLSMNYFHTAGAALVPPAVAIFREKNPGVQLDLKLNDPAYSLDEVLAKHADVDLMVLAEHTAERPGIRFVHLLDDPYHVVLPSKHPLARKRSLDLSELADQPWVDTEWPHGVCRQVMLDACTKAGFSPHFVVESDDYPTALGFVEAGLGVTLVPAIALKHSPARVATRKLRGPTPVRSIYAVVRDAAYASPAVRQLVDALRVAARQDD
ncbi:MAG: LysR family transcriptional regulator [Pseudonocardiaceae bacterium]|nr:LysR family transcriptional regulator [Pseudonocardiaceae bacterium]